MFVCLSESLCPDLQELECTVSASQQEASSIHSRLEGEISDLKALVEAEVNTNRQAEEQHKAAQADLAHRLSTASSLTRQLESSQAEILSQVCVMYLSRVHLSFHSVIATCALLYDPVCLFPHLPLPSRRPFCL